MTPRIINDAGRNIVMSEETLQLHAYLCPAGIPTIGYGHTGDVKMGDTITAHQAEVILEYDLRHFEEVVSRLAPMSNANEFSALVSFAFNLGEESLASSTLLKRFLAGQKAAAAAEFPKWCHARNPKTGKMEALPGLVRRRARERALFLQAVS